MRDEINCESHVLWRKTVQVHGGPTVHVTEFDTFDASLFLDCTPLMEDPKTEGHISTTVVDGTSIVFSRVEISKNLWQYELSFSGAEGPTRLRIASEIEEQLGKSYGQESWNAMDEFESPVRIDGRMWQVHVT